MEQSSRPLPLKRGAKLGQIHVGALALLLGALIGLAAAAAPDGRDFAARIDRVLARTPLIDGHNDLPWEIRDRFKGRGTLKWRVPRHPSQTS